MLGYYSIDEDLQTAKIFCTLWGEKGVDIPPDLCYEILDIGQGDDFAAIDVYSLIKTSESLMWGDAWKQAHELIKNLAKILNCTTRKILDTMPGHLLGFPKTRTMVVYLSIATLSMASAIVKKYSENDYKIVLNEYDVEVVVRK